MDNHQPLTNDVTAEIIVENSHMHHTFYEKIRQRIHHSISRYSGKKYKGLVNFILLIPDFVMLIIGLLRDKDLPREKKIFLAAILVYVLLPLDIIPDFIPVIGYMDDLVLIAMGLETIFVGTDREILHRHWHGDGNVLDTIRSVMKIGSQALSGNVLGRLSRWIHRHNR